MSDGGRLGGVRTVRSGSGRLSSKRLGQVEYAVLQFGGFPGLGSDYYPIPWSKLTYDVEHGGFIIDISVDTLERAPHYTSRDEPIYDRDYNSQVYDYYGANYP